MITIEDLVERVNEKERILLDVRPFQHYVDCHMKGSFNMNQQIMARFVEEKQREQFQEMYGGAEQSNQAPVQSALSDCDRRVVQVYLEFLKAYQENYPSSFIVLVGDREEKGDAFGSNVIMQSEAPIRNICVLKGGIDAVKVEHPELLRKRSSQQKEDQMIAQFEKFVKNAKSKNKAANSAGQEELL